MATITDATRWTAAPNDDHALFVIDVFADGRGGQLLPTGIGPMTRRLTGAVRTGANRFAANLHGSFGHRAW